MNTRNIAGLALIAVLSCASGIATIAGLVHFAAKSPPPDPAPKPRAFVVSNARAAEKAELAPTKDDMECAMLAAQKLPLLPSLVVTSIKSEPLEAKKAAQEFVNGYRSAIYAEKQLRLSAGYFAGANDIEAIENAEKSGRDQEAKDKLAALVGQQTARSERVILAFKAGAIEGSYSFVCGFSQFQTYFVGLWDYTP